MKPYHSKIVLLIIVCSAIATGKHGYNSTRDDIVADMNQALEQTLAAKQEGWIKPDTIVDYRSHLRIATLKESSLFSYAMESNGFNLKSKRMTWHNGKEKKLEFSLSVA